MGIFVRYLEDWVQRKKKKIFVFMTVNILEYDFFYKSVKFELWADNRREIK